MIVKKVRRNEPCPCGSGKKYKKCCGAKETVSITSLIENEALDLQTQIINYALVEYEMYLAEDLKDRLGEIETDSEEELEFYAFVHAVWFTLFVPFEDGKTILEKFIEDRGKMIQRPRLKEFLYSWADARPLAGRMISLSSDHIIVKEALTEEVTQIKLLEPLETGEEIFLFGITVPFGQERVFFPIPFDLDASEDFKEERFLISEYANSPYENPIEFLQDGFFELMYEMQFVQIEYGADDFEWSNPAHKKVAEIFEKEMKDSGAPSAHVGFAMILWIKYCEKEPVQRKKPATNAAAIHYLALSLNPIFQVTKKEISDMHGVSPSSLSNAVKKIEEVLDEEISDIKTMIYDDLLKSLEEDHVFDMDDE